MKVLRKFRGRSKTFSKSLSSGSLLSLHILLMVCELRWLPLKDILMLAVTCASLSQSLTPYICSNYWFSKLTATPFIHYSPTKLRINSSTSKNVDIPTLPVVFPDLLSLELRDISPLSFLSSMTTLTSLHLQGKKMDISKLPPSLQTLRVTGTFKNLNNVLRQLPELKTLVIEEMIEYDRGHYVLLSKDDLITYLPPTLTHLTLPHNVLNPAQPLSFPPKLLALNITLGTNGASFINTTFVDLQRNYPQTITSLGLAFPSLPSLSDIPPYLTTLVIIAKDFDQDLSSLPSTLKYLTVHTKSKFDRRLDELPTNLVSLKLSLANYEHPLDNLPLNLAKLKFAATSYTLPFTNLPDTLTSLYISIHSYTHAFPDWPPHLKKLTLRLPFKYNHTIPPSPSTVIHQNVVRCHREVHCWCNDSDKFRNK